MIHKPEADDNIFSKKPDFDKLSKNKDIRKLSKLLEHRENHIRWGAINALGQINDESAIPPLIAQLEHPDHLQRSFAILALKNKINPEVIAALSNHVMQDITDDEKKAVLEVFDTIKSPIIITPLIQLLKDNNQEIRLFSLKILAEHKTNQSIHAFIELLNDRNKEIRNQSIKILGAWKAEEAVEPLKSLLFDKSKPIQKAAAVSLQNIGWKPTRDKYGVSCSILLEDWETCASLGDLAVDQLKELIDDRTAKTRMAAVKTIGRIGTKQAQSVLMQHLDHSDLKIKEIVKDLVSNSEVDINFEALVQNMESTPLPQKYEKSIELINLGWQPEKEHHRLLVFLAAKILEIMEVTDEKSFDLLNHVIHEDDDITRVKMAIQLMLQTDKDMLTDILINRIHKSESRIKELGNAAFRAQKLDEMKKFQTQKDSETAMYSELVIALGKTEAERAVEPLLSLIKSEHPINVDAVISALIQLGKPAAGQLIELLGKESVQSKTIAAKALGEIGFKPAAGYLIVLLRHTDSNLRNTASDSIVKINNAALLPKLKQLLITAQNEINKAEQQLANLPIRDSAESLASFMEDDSSGHSTYHMQNSKQFKIKENTEKSISYWKPVEEIVKKTINGLSNNQQFIDYENSAP